MCKVRLNNTAFFFDFKKLFCALQGVGSGFGDQQSAQQEDDTQASKYQSYQVLKKLRKICIICLSIQISKLSGCKQLELFDKKAGG